MAKKTNPLTSYGYPKPRQIRKQAKQLAAASVTPASQIRKQYARAQGDASGFTQALVSLLGGQQSAYTGAANDALAQQQAIDSSAVSRLGGIDPAYQGAQVATGALGDSAASRQVSQGLALKGYGAQQPGIAASRGALAQIGLTNAMQDALDQRRTQLHQAYQQALPQVQQNALSMATAAANIQQANQGLALQYAQLNQQNSQFQQTQAQQWAEFNISRKDAKKAAKAASISPSEFRQEAAIAQGIIGAPKAATTKVPIYSTRADGTRYVSGYKQVQVQGQDTRDIAQKGTPFRAALKQLLAAGVQPQVAQVLLGGLYSKYAKAPTDSPAFRAYLSYYHTQFPDRISRAERRNKSLTGPH